jgi:hypothetical protein
MPYHGEKFKLHYEKARYSHVLTTWYNHYNRKFYGNKLPALKSYWYPFRKKLTHAATFFEEGIPTRLLFNVNLKQDFLGRMCLISLLHEMQHVATPKAMHGRVFKREQNRIIKRGGYKELL